MIDAVRRPLRAFPKNCAFWINAPVRFEADFAFEAV
jgi:hypothetical protein